MNEAVKPSVPATASSSAGASSNLPCSGNDRIAMAATVVPLSYAR